MIYEVRYAPVDLGIGGGEHDRTCGFIEIPDSRNCAELRKSYARHLPDGYKLIPVPIRPFAEIVVDIRASGPHKF